MPAKKSLQPTTKTHSIQERIDICEIKLMALEQKAEFVEHLTSLIFKNMQKYLNLFFIPSVLLKTKKKSFKYIFYFLNFVLSIVCLKNTIYIFKNFNKKTTHSFSFKIKKNLFLKKTIF